MALCSTKSHATETPMPHVLVLAVGNPLRSDDGLAWRAAGELRRSTPPAEIKIVKVHQLTPELAEDVSRAALVIFVDAAATGEPGTLNCERVVASVEESASSHSFTPAALLQLSAALYGTSPVAFLVSVTGKSFEHGDSLSPEIEQALPHLVAKIQELMLRTESI
jgi:hydrogenase maturation protease